LGKLLGEIALGGLLDKRLGRSRQRSVTRKPSRTVRPESIRVEAGDLAKGIEAAAMGIAGQVAEFLEFAEDGQVDRRAESSFEIRKGRRLGANQEPAQRLGGEDGSSHNVRVTTS
jgi:hypothetical protein